MAKNEKYGARPEVLKQVKYTPRDERLARAKVLVQGIVATPPSEWTESQLQKAKAIKLNQMSSKELRNWFDNEVDD